MDITHTIFQRKPVKGRKERRTGKWVLRFRYRDPEKGIRTKEYQFDYQGDAKAARTVLEKRLRDEIARRPHADLSNESGDVAVEGEKLTFDTFADICERELFCAAEFDGDGLKTVGVKSPDKYLSLIRPLRRYFGKRLIRSITEDDLLRYRGHRTNPKDENVRAVGIVSVNRELSTLSWMWTYATKKQWVFVVSPFVNRKKVIRSDRETARTRILSRDEESRLIAACSGTFPEYKYKRRWRWMKSEEISASRKLPVFLRGLILTAISSGARLGELKQLQWSDIDFDRQRITIHAGNTKTERKRETLLSARAASELLTLQASGTARPFPVVNINKAFRRVCEIAEIRDMHFHDLRRTAVSRWQAAGIPLAMAQAFAGHANSGMTATVYTAVAPEMHDEFVERVNLLDRKYEPLAAGNGDGQYIN